MLAVDPSTIVDLAQPQVLPWAVKFMCVHGHSVAFSYLITYQAHPVSYFGPYSPK